MKYAKYLLLLLLTVSCASHKSVRQRSLQADIRPDVPLEVQTQTLSNSPVEGENSLPAREDWEEASWQAVKQRALDSLCGSPIFEITQLGMYVYDLTDGQPLYAVNAAHRMRPASCQKIVTAVTALDCLTGDYQLQTDFRITGTVTGGVLNGDLYVVGGMDPLVTASELLQAAATIKQQQGIERIAGNIFYDLSMREDTPLGWGWCWDDDYGPLSALLVDGKATFEQNWTEALRKVGIKTPSNFCSPSHTLPNCSASNRQLPVKGENKKSPFKGDLEGPSVCSIRHGIDDLLVPMMKNSDNIYAECLFYQIAAQTGQKYAGHKQAAGYTEELMRRIGLDPDQYRVADGSGLSLYNYVSAEMLVAMLCHAWRTPGIRDHLLPSLPIAGFDGTLQKRMIGTAAEGNVRAKTGTVTGVVSLAGYLTAANGHTLAFAIINQGVPSSSIGRAFQDEVCEMLCK